MKIKLRIVTLALAVMLSLLPLASLAETVTETPSQPDAPAASSVQPARGKQNEKRAQRGTATTPDASGSASTQQGKGTGLQQGKGTRGTQGKQRKNSLPIYTAFLQELLGKGVIDQATYDSILAYLNGGATTTAVPELPAAGDAV